MIMLPTTEKKNSESTNRNSYQANQYLKVGGKTIRVINLSIWDD